MTLPAADTFTAKMYMAYGANQEQVLLNKSESSSAAGFRKVIIPVELAPSATDTQVNLASYVDTATWIGIEETSTGTTGFNYNKAAANKFQVAANGAVMFKNREATPPTLYFDNPDAANKVMLEITVLGTSD